MKIKLLKQPAFAIEKVPCECEVCGKRWTAAVKTISRGVGCPVCGRAAIREKQRTSNQELDRLGANLGFVWLEYPPNSQTPSPAKCLRCSHIWQNRSSSASRGAACPQCSGNFVSDETWKERAAAKNIVWLQMPAGARIPTSARCLSCGLEWKANPGHIGSSGGCPACAEYGFNPSKPALVYFLARETGIHGRAARKLGITNAHASKVRLTGFAKLGFKAIKTWEFPVGSVAARVEFEILHWIRHELHMPQELDREEMPIGGATETFGNDSVSDLAIIERVDALVAMVAPSEKSKEGFL